MHWRRIGKAVLFPPMALLIPLFPASLGAMLYGMRRLGENHPATIAAYTLSFYALAAWCVRAPAVVRFLKRFKHENRYISRWLSDPRLRMNVLLSGNVLWNGAYGMLQLGLGIYHRSAWFYSLAAYYASLACMRFFLVRHTLRHRPGEEMRRELKEYRACGWIFLLMNLALSGMIFHMIRENRATRHHEITTIALAAYTFATLTWAIISVPRYRRYHSPALSAYRMVSLAAACVSMLTLENTMLVTFGKEGMTAQVRRLFLALSGGTVSVCLVAMAVYMIAQTNRKMKEWRIDMENKDTFKMTYSAQQQEEIQAIRRKYVPQEEDKMTQLRALDARAPQRASRLSMIVGLSGTLIMGVGMSLVLSDFGAALGAMAIPAGTVIGAVGLAILALAYPLYRRVLKRERERVAPEILRLSEELMK